MLVVIIVRVFTFLILVGMINTYLLKQMMLQSHMIKVGLDYNITYSNHLLNLYIKCGRLLAAHHLFGEMPQRNTISYNIILSSCSKTHDDRKKHKLRFLKEMLLERIRPDQVTLVHILASCTYSKSTSVAIESVHSYALKSGHSSCCIVGGVLVNVYAKHGMVEKAHNAFEEIESKDVVAWNTMISCYSCNGMAMEAIGLFKLMHREGVAGDGFTFSSLASACRCLGCEFLASQLHCLGIRTSMDHDGFTTTALVDMYSKIGHVEEARKLFDLMDRRTNVVSWNAIIVGYTKTREGHEPMKLFKRMMQLGLRPDEITVASVVSSHARQGVRTEAAQLHTCAVKYGLETFLSVGNSLIDSYMKCGSIDDTLKAFNSVENPDIVTWTALISAYAVHGFAGEALGSFKSLLSQGLQPDHVTFLAVLSACSHAGLVETGLGHFNSMIRRYKIMPRMEHYTCLVDLLGRAGYISKAFALVTSIAAIESTSILGAFLAACKVHGNMPLAAWAAAKLFNLEPSVACNYKLMSNMFAASKHWRYVSRVRKMMKERCSSGSGGIIGCSWIEIEGLVHVFLSRDESHPSALSVYMMLDIVTCAMKVHFHINEGSGDTNTMSGDYNLTEDIFEIN